MAGFVAQIEAKLLIRKELLKIRATKFVFRIKGLRICATKPLYCANLPARIATIFITPHTMLNAILAISIGSALGALLRWQLGLKFNEYLPTLPLGTLAANIIGGYIIGVAVAFFAHASDVPMAWRLFIITGFCGGLTTFSTFSAEIVNLLQAGRIGWAVLSIVAHLSGSLLATVLGMLSWEWLRRA